MLYRNFFHLKKIYSIALIIAFVAVILQPVIPFVQYYYAIQDDSVSIQDNCDCACQTDEPAKMASNGDAYLKALIKRVCNDKKKETPKVPVINLPVFVRTLYVHRQQIYELSENNYNKISDFIIQPPTSSYIEELLHPPQFS